MITRRALLGAAGAVVAAGKKRNRRKWPVGWQQDIFPLLIVAGDSGGVFIYNSAGQLVDSMAFLANVDPQTKSNKAGIENINPANTAYVQLNDGQVVTGFGGASVLNMQAISAAAAQIATAVGASFAVIVNGSLLQLISPQVQVSASGGGPATSALLEVDGTAQFSGGMSTGQGLAIQTLANGSTINTAGKTMQPVTAAASVTGIILQAGTFDGQTIELPSDAGAGVTITFAAAATSHVKTGVGTVIQPGSTLVLKWVAATSLWYPVQ